jgi:hypothetical protein
MQAIRQRCCFAPVNWSSRTARPVPTLRHTQQCLYPLVKNDAALSRYEAREFRWAISTAQAEKSYRRELLESGSECALKFVTFALAAGKIGSAR